MAAQEASACQERLAHWCRWIEVNGWPLGARFQRGELHLPVAVYPG